MTRAVGYCENDQCEDYAKGVFLLNHGSVFLCPRCRMEGKQEYEKGETIGDFGIFKEVRIEYNFDSIKEEYRELAIIIDESIISKNYNVYKLKSPLVKTQKRALGLAESILANLNAYAKDTDKDLIRKYEYVISFDAPLDKIKNQLHQLSECWKESGLAHRD